MTKVLKAFGFGEVICRLIDTFYRKINSTVVVNVQTSLLNADVDRVIQFHLTCSYYVWKY